MTPQPIRPTMIHETTGYSHAVRAGHTLYVSGQVARDPENRIVGVGNVEAQTRQVFANLQRVLEAADASFRSVAKMTTYLTNRRDFQAWRRVRDEVLESPYPASTLVVVGGLSYPEYLVEIEAIAVLDG